MDDKQAIEEQAKKQNRIGAILGLLVVICLVAIIVCAIKYLIIPLLGKVTELFSIIGSLDSAIVVALITGTISIVSVVGGAIFTNIQNAKLKRDEYLRDHREGAYRQLVKIFYDYQVRQRSDNPMSNEELLRLMNEFNQELTLWGSTKAIQKWGKWRVSPTQENKTGQELMFDMEQVIIQVRRDLGQKRGLRKGDILRLTVNDIDNVLKKSGTNVMS